MEYPVCKHCGSRNVTTDAVLKWHLGRQCWATETLLPNADCQECGGQTTLEWRDTNEYVENQSTI